MTEIYIQNGAFSVHYMPNAYNANDLRCTIQQDPIYMHKIARSCLYQTQSGWVMEGLQGKRNG